MNQAPVTVMSMSWAHVWWIIDSQGIDGFEEFNESKPWINELQACNNSLTVNHWVIHSSAQASNQ